MTTIAARAGLFVARDGSSLGTVPLGARLALGGLLQGNSTALNVRDGVLCDDLTAVVSGTGAMTYNIRAARFVIKADAAGANGPVIACSDSVVNVATTAAPGANSRIDVVWVRQHLISGDGGADSDVLLEFNVTQGTAAASPTAPSIPSGALSLAQVTVTTGATSTTGLTFVRSHQWAAANGGIIPIFSSAERAGTAPFTSWTPSLGQVIYYQPDDELQHWNGTTWIGEAKSTGNAWTTYTPTWSNVTLGTTGLVNTAKYQVVGKLVTVKYFLTLGTGGATTGAIGMTLPVPYPCAFTEYIANGTFITTDGGSAGSRRAGTTYFNSQNLATSFLMDDNSGDQRVDVDTPYTWAATDQICGILQYEIA